VSGRLQNVALWVLLVPKVTPSRDVPLTSPSAEIAQAEAGFDKDLAVF
jgi:hypothetical protein